MNYKTVFLSLIFVFTISIAKSQGFVIDHNCVDIDQIPAAIIDDIQQNIKWHYAHTSHGHSLTCGLESLENTNSTYDIELEFNALPSAEDALCIFDGQENFTYITPEGYYLLESGMSWTLDVLNNNPEINVSAFCWCTQMEYYDATDLQIYFDSLAALENYFPDVTFIYFTGNAQKNSIFGYQRYQNNEIIRQYCKDNDKILFDFADLDCWYNGEMNYYLYDGDTIPLEHDAYGGDSCGHVNVLSNTIKAKAVWWMMARLRGWDPDARPVNLKLFLEGPYENGSMHTTLASEGFIPLDQPFNMPPWNYTGTESLATIPTDAVDWILIDYRDAGSPGDAITNPSLKREAALLRADGSVISVDETLPVAPGNINDWLFVIVQHRNHLGILSSLPANFYNGMYNYDFTVDIFSVWGGPAGYKTLKDGTCAMVGGDGDCNQEVNTSDKIQIWSPLTGSPGYQQADYNLDGQVDNSDKNQVWKKNLGLQSPL